MFLRRCLKTDLHSFANYALYFIHYLKYIGKIYKAENPSIYKSTIFCLFFYSMLQYS